MDKEHLADWINKLQNLPYHKFIGMEISSWGSGTCVIQVPLNSNILGPYGVIHGGIYYTVCDAAASIATSTMIPNESLPVTSDINVSILAPVSEGVLRVEANVIKIGRRTCFAQSQVFNEKDEPVAVARVTKSLIPNPVRI